MYTAISKHGKCVPFKMYIYNMSYTHQRGGSRLLMASHRFLCTVGWCGMFSARDERSKTVPECKCTTSPIGLIFTWKNVYCIQAKEFSNLTNPYQDLQRIYAREGHWMPLELGVVGKDVQQCNSSNKELSFAYTFNFLNQDSSQIRILCPVPKTVYV